MEKKSVRQLVLQELKDNIETSISGEELAQKIGVSRAAVWKSINALKEQGYIISATTNKGYMLSLDSDVLSKDSLAEYIKDEVNIFVYDTVDSTNTQAKKLSLENKENLLVVSQEQTAGRGRMGRSFYSPLKTGVYMSMALRLNLEMSNAILITTAVSVAVCKALEEVVNKTFQIKWVNDIYLENKKVCGILTEAVTNFETGTIDCVIVGIGVNIVLNENLPEDLKEIVGSVFSEGDNRISRNEIIAKIYNQVKQSLCEKDLDNNFIREYKERSCIIGKAIKFCENNVWNNAKAVDIDEKGGLIVELETGKKHTLNSGEISVRKFD